MASDIIWESKYDDTCAMHKLFMELVKKYDIEKYCELKELKLHTDTEKSKFNYHTMHKWSIDNIEKFWETFYDFSKIISSESYSKVLGEYCDISEIPKWFIGCKLNYAENVLRYNDDNIAITQLGEGVTETNITFKELNENVRRIAKCLKACGIKKGDVVGSILPNVAFAVECMLATTSLGGIWTCASPETQFMGIVMRMKQTNPKILISYDQVTYNGKLFSQVDKLRQLSKEMDTLQHVVITTDISKTLTDYSSIEKGISLDDFEKKYYNKDDEFVYEQVSFDSPLFIMYSSGTTGIPKGLVHSVGGTLIQHLKDHMIHENIKRNDVFFYYTITAWMMWNWLVTSLATGCRIVTYNGSPFYPGKHILWESIEKLKVSIFGGGAAYYQGLENDKFDAKSKYDLSSLRVILSTGSVLPHHTYDYLLNYIKDDLLIGSIAAATDVISCFGGINPLINVYRGQVQNKNLAMGIESWDENGASIFDCPGELVVIKPFPSMPVYLWNDNENKKYLSTYFSKYKGVWAQGDFCQMVKETNGIIMLGRSDATLNPFGVRIGSSEIYAVVENIDNIEDSLCVSQMHNENERIILFLKLKNGDQLTSELNKQVCTEIRNQLSARHVPSLIIQIGDIPYTLTGKKIEMAIKRILNKEPFVIQKESLRNPEALDLFQDLITQGKL